MPSNWFKNYIYFVLSSNCEMEVREGVKKIDNFYDLVLNKGGGQS